MNQTLENGNKPNFWPDFDPFDQIWAQKFFLCVLLLVDVRHCCKLSSYVISKEDPNSKKIAKKLILILI